MIMEFFIEFKQEKIDLKSKFFNLLLLLKGNEYHC